ncbi:hypothetical protein J6524_33875 [Bradyrhizobium sp. WSM 1738]|uniref:hypothetical protein n=1 Tax=Bradyrhizobium hereditatis TaxID=2821405 RepID=UPI001CE38CD2|nr:hypothetical protein [Bradyrhizobium hereditatis]MCA6119828.1 hypothetical protein [Bradyrhizobium hereditatis]
MLSDPDAACFITPDGKAITTEISGWRNAAVISGHWALHRIQQRAFASRRAAIGGEEGWRS